jgi:hypothetical protein
VPVTTLCTRFDFSPTKACIVASVIFVLDKKTDLISAPHALVYFGIVIFFVYFKVSKYLKCMLLWWSLDEVLDSCVPAGCKAGFYTWFPSP